MSKHIFRQQVVESKYEVQIGWDKPCQRFYFVISPFITKGEFAGELDDPVFCNLDLPSPDHLTLDQIATICEAYGLTLPTDILANVANDRNRNVVNDLKFY